MVELATHVHDRGDNCRISGRRRLPAAAIGLWIGPVALVACSSGEPSAPIDQSVLIRVDAASSEVTSVVPVGPGSRMMATAAGPSCCSASRTPTSDPT